MSGIRTALALAVIALAIASCSGKEAQQPRPDAEVPVDAATACEQRQRDYVNNLLSPDQQIDVGVTVSAVLDSADLLGAMPYCSGERPVAAPAR